MLKAIIVEDEKPGRENLQNMLKQYCPNVEVIAFAEDIESAYQLLKEPSKQPDIAFLDINLPDGIVFQLFNKLDVINFDPIIVTAYEKYAIKAYDFGSLGYILKPIDADKLKEAVDRADSLRKKYLVKNRNPSEENRKRVKVVEEYMSKQNNFGKISISAMDGYHFVNITDIIRLEGDDNYTHIFTATDKLTAAKTIKSFDEILTGSNFFRVHKTHLINLNYMVKFLKTKSFVVMKDGREIEVSRRRRPVFLELMKKLRIDAPD